MLFGGSRMGNRKTTKGKYNHQAPASRSIDVGLDNQARVQVSTTKNLSSSHWHIAEARCSKDELSQVGWAHHGEIGDGVAEEDEAGAEMTEEDFVQDTRQSSITFVGSKVVHTSTQDFLFNMSKKAIEICKE
ncbi:hypothetical protein F53441_14650 [Fusarium austroafricanum]|uniref:Uncharacterized protein n=1 Tax=Fusarium austroafricanum TaxID=2364996 RepID=A0A8H4JBA3_9HYPO|nr:hypothetical protein F53441_14650 [Fusarium austroafricanum]